LFHDWWLGPWGILERIIELLRQENSFYKKDPSGGKVDWLLEKHVAFGNSRGEGLVGKD